MLMQEELCATVEDDGKGFDIQGNNNESNNRFGLSIMRERASEMGAKMEIQSILEKGSRILLRVSTKRARKNENESDVGR